MSTYTSYQCSICRRTIDIVKDNTRAAINQCTITKGCEGRLFKIGESSTATSMAARSDLINWYPRGEQQNIVPVNNEIQTLSLSCSSTGVLTLAIYQSDLEAEARTNLVVKLTQRRIEDISYQQYVFRPSISTTLISGRDTSGKNLRFDQNVIDEGRIFVRINGVSKSIGSASDQITLSPNTISFNSEIAAQSSIDVSIYFEKDTIEKTLTFTANKAFVVNSNSGAWGNIRYITEYGSDGNLKPNKWWLYSCTGFGDITTSSRLKLDSILEENGVTVALAGQNLINARFLIASEPFGNTDRYLNFLVECATLNEGYMLSTVNNTITELLTDINSLKEIYPPFQLVYDTVLQNSSFVTTDTFISSDAIPTDTALTRLVGKKTIGPI